MYQGLQWEIWRNIKFNTFMYLAHFICLKAKVVKFHIQKTVAQNFSHQSSTDVTNKRLLTIEL